MDSFPVTDRSRVKLFGNRASHERADVYRVIDDSIHGIVAWTLDGQPFSTPTMMWRRGDYVYWHGSAGSRMLKTVQQGGNLCVTFVHVDGFVMSRLASAHAMNYRSVMIFGNAEPVADLQERRDQLEFFLNRLFPGRWDEVKQPSLAELNSIIMVRMRIEEASLKRRSGLPADGQSFLGGEALYDQACWAGVLPMGMSVGEPIEADRLKNAVETPVYLQDFADRFGLVEHEDDGQGSIQAEIRFTRDLTANVRLFRLVPLTTPFPAVTSGAHLRVAVVLGDQTRDWRHYTIVDADPDGEWYEIAVLREGEGRGGSRYLHEQLMTGDIVRLTVPANEFEVTPGAASAVLIAGGIGITPMMSMARTLAAGGGAVALHYSARGEENAPFLQELRRADGLDLTFYDTATQARMVPEHAIGPWSPGRHVYVCGPHHLIRAVVEAAESLGYPANAIHREAFGAPPVESTDATVQLTLQKSGKSVLVVPGTSLLDALSAEGAILPHSCKRGECGLCVTRVLDGDVIHRDHYLDAEGRAAGLMCPCVSWAASPALALDV